MSLKRIRIVVGLASWLALPSPHAHTLSAPVDNGTESVFRLNTLAEDLFAAASIADSAPSVARNTNETPCPHTLQAFMPRSIPEQFRHEASGSDQDTQPFSVHRRHVTPAIALCRQY